MANNAQPLTQITPSFDGDKPIIPGDFGWGFTHDAGDRTMRVVMYAEKEFDSSDVTRAIMQRQAKASARLARNAALKGHQTDHRENDGYAEHEIKGERREMRARRREASGNGYHNGSNGDGLSVRRAEHGPAHVHVIVFDSENPQLRARESRFMLMDCGDGTYDCEMFHKNSHLVNGARRNGHNPALNNGKHAKVPDLLDGEIDHIRRHIIAHAPEFLAKWQETNQGAALEKQVWAKNKDGNLGSVDPEDPNHERVTINLASGDTADVYSTRLANRIQGLSARRPTRLPSPSTESGHSTPG